MLFILSMDPLQKIIEKGGGDWHSPTSPSPKVADMRRSLYVDDATIFTEASELNIHQQKPSCI